MNPWLIYPSWQNFSSLFREISIAAAEKTEFLRYHHLTSSLYFAISFIEALLNEKYRTKLESEGKPEAEIVFILRRGSSATKPKEGRSFEEKFSEWPSLICGKEVKVSEDLRKVLVEFNEVRGNLTHPKSRGHDIYADLEKVYGQQLLHSVAEYAVTVHSALGEEYPYWLFGWNYLNANETACDPSRINNQQFLHSLEYLGATVRAYDGHANNAWRNAFMKDFGGYRKIGEFLVACCECEPFDRQFPYRPNATETAKAARPRFTMPNAEAKNPLALRGDMVKERTLRSIRQDSFGEFPEELVCQGRGNPAQVSNRSRNRPVHGRDGRAGVWRVTFTPGVLFQFRFPRCSNNACRVESIQAS